MNQREYEEKYAEIKSELRELEEKQQACSSLKKAIETENEDRERDLKVTYTRNKEIEEDWHNRNMIGNKGYLFHESEAISSKINSGRSSLLRNGFDDLNQYIEKLSWREKEYQERLSKLTQEYEDHKEEKNGQTDTNLDAFDAAVDKVVSETDNVDHDEVLYEYFAETKSDAPYLIADKYIEKIANTSKDNKIILPNQLKEDQERVIDTLNELNERAGKTIYDPDNNCLNVQNPSSLTAEEKYAILAAYTGNVTYNSFAAEVEFHSDALVDWKKHIPLIGKSKWYNAAIRADMAIGEEKESNSGFDEYYNLDSDIVQSQRDTHGDK